ncbi:MAG: entericidin A/B family lipoprotein [Gammaproteobacteria bacterium]|nr:entericidin A/B family lipoprotein [Gammaproteobacteria bacterium]MCP5299875.1 entericidin A/B family lipoprotein [Chromatiaceae bacterium]
MKPVQWLLLTAILLGALSGCETIKGVGRDITNAGEAIEDAVR